MRPKVAQHTFARLDTGCFSVDPYQRLCARHSHDGPSAIPQILTHCVASILAHDLDAAQMLGRAAARGCCDSFPLVGRELVVDARKVCGPVIS